MTLYRKGAEQMKAKVWTAVIVLGGLSIIASESYGCAQYPVAILSAEPEYVMTYVNVAFDGNSSYDPDGTITLYEWDWEDDGTYDCNQSPPCDGNAIHDYNDAGTYTVRLRVTDNEGYKSTATCTVYVNILVSVPGDVNTIQEAIDAADPCGGTTITVSR
jgi:PKD repeat protein